MDMIFTCFPKETSTIGDWYGRYGPMVIRCCMNILHNKNDINDAVQDVFLKLLKILKRRPIPSKGLSTYIWKTTVSVCYEKLRSEKRNVKKLFLFFRDPIQETFDDPLVLLLQKVYPEIIRTVLEKQPEHIRTIYDLRYVHNPRMTFKQIGEAMRKKKSKSWVEKELKSFLKQLRVEIWGG